MMYIQAMKESSAYAGGVELNAIHDKEKIAIKVHSSLGEKSNILLETEVPYNQNESINLILFDSLTHYDPLVYNG